jgi:hypothetical protein
VVRARPKAQMDALCGPGFDASSFWIHAQQSDRHKLETRECLDSNGKRPIVETK